MVKVPLILALFVTRYWRRQAKNALYYQQPGRRSVGDDTRERARRAGLLGGYTWLRRLPVGFSSLLRMFS